SSPDNSVYVFIDNSNLFIEGSKIVSRLENVNVCDNKQPNFLDFYVDHGQLVMTVLHGRKMSSAFVIGSVPPPNDTLWDRARSYGCEVKTYQRNASNKEKKVDTKLVCRAMRSILTKNHSTLLLVAGDSDYCPLIEEAREENWNIETWFWDGTNLPYFSTGMSSELRNISSYVP
ncbi:7210_t:CDS:1, partial [Funneliformis geosporum]